MVGWLAAIAPPLDISLKLPEGVAPTTPAARITAAADRGGVFAAARAIWPLRTRAIVVVLSAGDAAGHVGESFAPFPAEWLAQLALAHPVPRAFPCARRRRARDTSSRRPRPWPAHCLSSPRSAGRSSQVSLFWIVELQALLGLGEHGVVAFGAHFHGQCPADREVEAGLPARLVETLVAVGFALPQDCGQGDSSSARASPQFAGRSTGRGRTGHRRCAETVAAHFPSA